MQESRRNESPLIIVTIACSLAGAQNFPMYVVKAGQDPRKALNDSIEYRFKDFVDGYVVTPEGKRSKSMKVNYSYLLSLPSMIGPNGDTLMINPDIIQQVWMDKVCYVKTHDSYFELITYSPALKLARQKYLRVFRTEMIGPDGW